VDRETVAVGTEAPALRPVERRAGGRIDGRDRSCAVRDRELDESAGLGRGELVLAAVRRQRSRGRRGDLRITRTRPGSLKYRLPAGPVSSWSGPITEVSAGPLLGDSVLPGAPAITLITPVVSISRIWLYSAPVLEVGLSATYRSPAVSTANEDAWSKVACKAGPPSPESTPVTPLALPATVLMVPFARISRMNS
jgi:hypothetical protein